MSKNKEIVSFSGCRQLTESEIEQISHAFHTDNRNWLKHIPVYVFRPPVAGLGFKNPSPLSEETETGTRHAETIFTSIRFRSTGIYLLDDPPFHPVSETIRNLIASSRLIDVLRGFLAARESSSSNMNLNMKPLQLPFQQGKGKVDDEAIVPMHMFPDHNPARYYVYLSVSEKGQCFIDWNVGIVSEQYRPTKREPTQLSSAMASIDSSTFPTKAKDAVDAQLWRNAAVITGISTEVTARAAKAQWRAGTEKWRRKTNELSEEMIEKVIVYGRRVAHKYWSEGAVFKLLLAPDIPSGSGGGGSKNVLLLE